MPDNVVVAEEEAPPEGVMIEVTDSDGVSQPLTEAELQERVWDCMDIVEMTVSIGETRQKRDYNPNQYHLSTKIDVRGIPTLMRSLTGDPVIIRNGKRIIMQSFVDRIQKRVAFMKELIWIEQERDKMPLIDRRKPEGS